VDVFALPDGAHDDRAFIHVGRGALDKCLARHTLGIAQEKANGGFHHLCLAVIVQHVRLIGDRGARYGDTTSLGLGDDANRNIRPRTSE
ncbi:MAG: hypothetical protein HUK20_02890, partial [Fibrobacter sp.]|nr:hypothetical protein [Fibrobacter sp.]